MKKEVLVETSARHVHVSREALDILFGEGYELTHKKISHSPVSLPAKRELPLSAQNQASPQFQSSVPFVPQLRLSFHSQMHAASALTLP